MNERNIRTADYNITQLQKMDLIAKYHISKHPDKQVIKAISELAELTEELCECLGNKLYLHEKKDWEMYLALFKEIFDAEFMILQMKMLFIDNEEKMILYNDIVNAQINREMKRRGLE